MGNCLKKSKIEPFDPENKSDHRASSRRPNSGLQAEMIMDLQDEGKEARVAGGGLSFVVDFTEGKKAKKPVLNKKKAKNLPHSDEDVTTYTVEEKALMADILRESQLKERTEKARTVDMKIYDAKRRRLLRDAKAEAIRKEGERASGHKVENPVSSDRVASPEI